jgi:predicted nucleotidyltransferase component of viral defense system
MNQEIDVTYMPPATAKIFELFAGQKFISNFTLVGGTALALQLRHRMSEDLDFVQDAEHLNVNLIKRNIAKLFPNYRIIRQDHSWQIDFIINEVKITFFSSGAVSIPFEVQKFAFAYKNLRICRADAIASLKLAAIAQRNTIRDYYDLYFISKYRISLKEIFVQTKKLIPGLAPITYSETLVYTADLDESSIAAHLAPKEIVTKEQIAVHFINELRKIKAEI